MFLAACLDRLSEREYTGRKWAPGSLVEPRLARRRTVAKIVLGMATSHGPLLSTPPDQWWQRGMADRKGFFELFFKGDLYSFDDLVRSRAGEDIQRELQPDVMAERHAACQK